MWSQKWAVAVETVCSQTFFVSFFVANFFLNCIQVLQLNSCKKRAFHELGALVKARQTINVKYAVHLHLASEV